MVREFKRLALDFVFQKPEISVLCLLLTELVKYLSLDEMFSWFCLFDYAFDSSTNNLFPTVLQPLYIHNIIKNVS